jgi:hypothetical protein
MAVHINELNEIFVVEWNSRKNKFQIRVLGELLKSNLLAAVNGRNSGCVPLAIAHTEAEALQISKVIKANVRNLRHQHGDSFDTLD